MESSINSNILRVDLSKEKISIEHPDIHFYRRYLGGQGFVTYYLLKELEKGIDPLSEKNKLIFAAGPVTGVPIAGAGRHAVGAKSPLTGGLGEAESGGFWGKELKSAEFDAIILEGKASDPVYLWVHDGEAEIRDASHLWGKVTGDVQEEIRKSLGDKFIKIAQIGPGGENMVRYACIINDLRDAAGRTGTGAVMGSKNLKAVAVRGNKKIKVASKSELKEIRTYFNEHLLKPYMEIFSHGTPVTGTMNDFVSSGNLPIRNFRDGTFDAAGLDPHNVKKQVNLQQEGCYACPLRCKKIVDIDEKWNYQSKYGGPEYETLAAFGSNCGIKDFEAVTKAHEICNKYSLDTISTGLSISLAMECFENEIISQQDTNGINLKFGNSDAMIQMIEKIGKKEGLGAILAEGAKKAAMKIGNGAENYAIHVKGQEIPMHEPRLKQGLGVGYAVSPTGADHMHNLHDTALTNKESVKQFNQLGIYEPLELDDLGPKKIRALAYHMNLRMMTNSLALCFFIPWNLHHLNGILRASSGMNTTEWELMKIGERITTMGRLYNIREGLTYKDDDLPDRFFSPPIGGTLAETAIDREAFKKGVKTYYNMMGWDDKGVPTKQKLDELDIGWCKQYL